MCTPKTLSVFLSAKIFTKPSASSLTLALEFAMKGNLPTLYSMDCFLSSSSVFPTDAISGWV